VCLLLGDAEAADAALTEAEALWAGRAPASWYHYSALTATWLGDLARARELLVEGIQHHPHAAALHNNLAVVLERAGESKDALKSAERGIAEDASIPQLHKNVGDLYYRAGRHDEARTAFERAVAEYPDLGGDVYLKLGNIHLRQRELAQAAACWQNALRLDPENSIARKNLEALEQLLPAPGCPLPAPPASRFPAP
jgi:Tfp pilus assembly protein PilF